MMINEHKAFRIKETLSKTRDMVMMFAAWDLVAREDCRGMRSNGEYKERGGGSSRETASDSRRNARTWMMNGMNIESHISEEQNLLGNTGPTSLSDCESHDYVKEPAGDFRTA